MWNTGHEVHAYTLTQSFKGLKQVNVIDKGPHHSTKHTSNLNNYWVHVVIMTCLMVVVNEVKMMDSVVVVKVVKMTGLVDVANLMKIMGMVVVVNLMKVTD